MSGQTQTFITSKLTLKPYFGAFSGNLKMMFLQNIFATVAVHKQSHLDTFGSYGHSSDYPDTFQILRTLFRSSGHFSDHLDTFQSIWPLWICRTLFRLFGHFSDHPDTFHQTILSLCRSSGHSRMFRTLLILSRHISDHPDTFGAWRLEVVSGFALLSELTSLWPGSG